MAGLVRAASILLAPRSGVLSGLRLESRLVQVVKSDELKFTFEIWMELFRRQHVSVK
jgi:hypothetical protein